MYGSSIDLSPDLLTQSSISCYASLSPPAQHVPSSLSFPKTPPPCRLLISVNNIHIPSPRGQEVNSYGCFLSSPPSHTLQIISPPKYILDPISFSMRLLTLPPLHTVAISFSACCINFLTWSLAPDLPSQSFPSQNHQIFYNDNLSVSVYILQDSFDYRYQEPIPNWLRQQREFIGSCNLESGLRCSEGEAGAPSVFATQLWSPLGWCWLILRQALLVTRWPLAVPGVYSSSLAISSERTLFPWVLL